MTHETHRLLAQLEKLGHPRILVLGDLILDRYTFGDAERISQEAPVLVLRADQYEARLGGASSVARLLRGLEADVTLVGVVGADADGRELKDLLSAEGVNHQHVLVDAGRPTTVKQRFIGRAQNRHPHQILRVDREERHAVSPSIADELFARIEPLLATHDVVLVSDYDKGVCSAGLLQQVIAAAKAARTPVVVDPIRASDYSKYKGATTMTPNRLEAQLATGLTIKDARDTCLIGKKLCKELGLAAAIITLDRDGMALVPPDGGGEVFPTRMRNVYDITGAGDMVLATIGLGIASGLKLTDAIRLGNVAGGLEVEKVGVEQVTRAEMKADLLATLKSAPGKIVTLTELVKQLGPRAKRSQKVVFTNGCFDLLHVGHATYLQEAAALGDILIVGLNSDDSVRGLKGPTRPVISENDRAAMLAAMSAVSYVVIFDAETPLELIRKIEPDVLIKGGNYEPSEIVGHEIVTAYGGQVTVTGMVEGMSTSNILKKVSGNVVRKPHYSTGSAREQFIDADETY